MRELEVRALSPACGVEVRGVDLSAPLDAAGVDALRGAFREHGLLLFRGSELSEEDLERAAGVFGSLSIEGEYGAKPFVSNVVPDGLVPNGRLNFHTDKSFTEQPLRGLMLYAYEVPPHGAGGDTVFADVALAYDRLPLELRRRVDSLQVVHSTLISAPPVTSTMPLAYAHPETGRTVIFYSAQFFQRFSGLGPERTEELARELDARIADPAIAYVHEWRPRDLMVWDNIRFQHARTAFDPAHRRHLRRIQISAHAAQTV